MKKTPHLIVLSALFLYSTVSWSLPPCRGSYGTNWTNCKGTHYLPDGSKYIGDFKYGEFHGYGNFTDPNLGNYVGEFKEGAVHGQGIRTYPNGRVEEGVWENGELIQSKKVTPKSKPPCRGSPGPHWTNCEGTDSDSTGTKYVGEWKNGNPHGQGTIIYANGNKYVGEFKDNKENGQGVFTFSNGGKYIGEFKDGNPHGQGTRIYVNGDKYIGEFKDGSPHGLGTYTFVNGEKYVGEFKDNYRHGQGIYTFADASVKEGIWENGDFKYAQKVTLRKRAPKSKTEYSKSLTDGEIYDLLLLAKKQLREKLLTTPPGNNAYETYQIILKEIPNQKVALQGIQVIYDLYVGWAEQDQKDGNYQRESFWRKKAEEVRLGKVTHESKPIPSPKSKTEPKFATKQDDNEIIPAASGTAFAVSYSGYVITNNHVIEGCENVKIHHKGNTILATVISKDPLNDIAVLKGNFKPTSIFALSGENPELMQEIFVAGYPFGQNISSSVKVTKGIVSSLTGLGNNFSNMQIDAAIQPGNSGGPIFDERGNVVGVAVSKLDVRKVIEEFGTIPENTNFGIKSNVVMNFLESNNIEVEAPTKNSISNIELGEIASDATYYLSCWMTRAQIKNLQSRKVIFDDLGQ